MFHHHCREKFDIGATAQACVGREAIELGGQQPTQRSDPTARSLQLKSRLSRFGRYLGDLAESRHSVR